MTPDGERIGPVVRIDSEPFELMRQIASWGEAPEVVLEATYGWYWAADVLTEAGARVHLAHPLGIKGFTYRRVKNDVRDAADLADLLRMGRLPEAWIAPPPVRELRELVRHRAKLVAVRSKTWRCCSRSNSTSRPTRPTSRPSPPSSTAAGAHTYQPAEQEDRHRPTLHLIPDCPP